MKHLVVIAIIFQMILSGCSPELGFHPSTSVEVIPTAPDITPKKPVVIKPIPSKKIPNPTPNNVGFLSMTNATLDRQADRTLILKGKVSLKDSQSKVYWTRDVELDGKLDPDFRAKLYPVNGDTAGDFKVRARLTCLEYETCDQAIIDIYVQTAEKMHATQVEVTMEPAPSQPQKESDLNKDSPAPEVHEGPAQPQRPPVNDTSPGQKSSPAGNQAAPRRNAPGKPQAPGTDTKPNLPATPARPRAQAPAVKQPSSTAKAADKSSEKASEKSEKPGLLARIRSIFQSDTDENKNQSNQPLSNKAPSVSSQNPKGLQTGENSDTLPASRPGQDSRPALQAPSEMIRTAENSAPKRSLLDRVLGRNKTPSLPAQSTTVAEKPKTGTQSPSVMSQAPALPQNQISSDQSLAAAEPMAAAASSQRPPVKPTVPAKPQQPTPLARENVDEAPEVDEIPEGLEHGAEEDEETTDEEEEKPSLYIGTLHEPTEDLFATDRPTTEELGSRRPTPRPDRTQNPGADPDDLEAANKGNRPRDQVIGKTGCGREDKGPSCGRLERASNLSSLESSGNFQMFNKSRQRFYGSHELLSIINYLGKYFKSNPSFGPLSVNDLSQKNGGKLKNSEHKSHQNGLDADISFPFNPERGRAFAGYVSGGSATASFESRKTWKVFKTLWDTGHVDRIFVNLAIKRALCAEASRSGDVSSYGQLLRRIRPERGHDKHFHLRILCSAENPRCRQMGAPPKGTGC